MRSFSAILVFCYGNPGRLDDGLGPAFGRRLEETAIAGVTVHVDYQLEIEDSTLLAGQEVVFFVDASAKADRPFTIRRVHPKQETDFTSHSLRPEALLSLAERLFGYQPAAYAVEIRGYEFDAFGEVLSPEAARNLNEALAWAVPLFRDMTRSGTSPSKDRPRRNAVCLEN